MIAADTPLPSLLRGVLIGRLGLGEGTGRTILQRTLAQLYDAALVVVRMVNALVLILVALRVN